MKKRRKEEKEDRELIIIGRPRRISDIGMEAKYNEKKDRIDKEKKFIEVKIKEEKPIKLEEFKEIKLPKTNINTSFYSDEKFQQAMIHNFVLTQKVMTDLAEKLDSLSDQTSKLLALFEISARSFIEKGEGGKTIKEDKDLLDKIDRLMEQNKLIAKGLTMIEDKVRTRVEPERAGAIAGAVNVNKPGMGQIPQRG